MGKRVQIERYRDSGLVTVPTPAVTLTYQGYGLVAQMYLTLEVPTYVVQILSWGTYVKNAKF